MGICTSSQGKEMIRINPDYFYRAGEADLIEGLLVNNRNNPTLNRRLGCAYGQALGDAYGLSTEFENRQTVAELYRDHQSIIPFPDYKPTHHSRRWRKGDWTDDTDQWILILDTLISRNGDERAFAELLQRWIHRGYPELGDHGGMGIGAHVNQVVSTPGYTKNPIKVSQEVWERGGRKSAPNGAVMRCSACAFVNSKDPEKLRDSTIRMCQATHVDPRCVASCLAICLLVGYLIERGVQDQDVESVAEKIRKDTLSIMGSYMQTKDRDEFLWFTDASRTLEDLQLDEPAAIGYTYKCLASGFYALRSRESFEVTMYRLIRYGGDADTNGAVCGTVYGARHGYSSLPKGWLMSMPFKRWLDQKIIYSLQRIPQ